MTNALDLSSMIGAGTVPVATVQPNAVQAQAPAAAAYTPPADLGFADPFDLTGAKPTDRSPSAPGGLDAVVEILKCEVIQAPNQGMGYVVHYRVLSCGDATQIGAEYAWKNWAKNANPFKTACAAFVKAVLGLDNTPAHVQALATQATMVIKASYGEAQPFKGKRVRLTAVATKTKTGFDFLRHDWSKAPAAA